MMGTQFGLLLGLDNAIVALALGPFNPGPRRMVLVGFTFATAEIVMTLGGALGGSALALVAESAGEAIRVGVLLLLAAAIVSGGVAAAACGVGSLSARLVAPSWRAAATAALLATAALAGAA